MEAAGLAIKEPQAPPASKPAPNAVAPPPPPPPPAAAPPPPPPPAALPPKPSGQDSSSLANSSARLKSSAPPPPQSSSCGLGVSAAEVLAQRHKLKKVEPAPKAPASSGGIAGDLENLIKFGLGGIRAGVADESTGEHSGKTWEFTSEFSPNVGAS
eukprot:746230-Hanusia_phi.AAC.8